MPAPFTTRPELLGTFGMISTTHWLASAAGMGILERGGNAFDAAVCAGFVLQVVEPHLNGPGGDLPILVYSAESRRVEVICAQGTAPAAATIDAIRGIGLDMIPGTGFLAACVPGAFSGWITLLRDHGTMRLRDVLEPAIGYAESGFPVVPRIAETVGTVADLFRSEWPESAELWLAGGGPRPGTTYRNRPLAETYRRVQADAEAAGRDREAQLEAAHRAWYEGFVAEAIDRFVSTTERMDVSGERHRGLLTGHDMATWRATAEPPAKLDYGRHTVFKTAAWGQGPVFLQQLGLLEGLDLAGMDVRGPDFVHLVVEAAKLAYADREAWYGDPNFAEVPIDRLLDRDYASERRTLIGERASLELRPGSPSGRAPRIPWRFGEQGPVDVAGVGDPTVTIRGETRGDTVHLDVIDRFGNMVSATPSGGWLQSSPAVPGLGFCLGTRAQIFNLEPGHPNALAPRKRPRTTLSPSMAFRDGEPYLAFGTPGADQQDQWSLNFFVTLVAAGCNLQEAIDAPMWQTDHFPRSFYPHQSSPGSLILEDRFDSATVDELRRRGHQVSVSGPWSQGRLCAVGRDVERGVLIAGANPRGMQGYAIGR